MEESMKHSLHWVLLVSAMLVIASGGAGWARTDQDQPEVSGTTQGNTGCAILEKHTPVKGKLLLLGVVYARTEYRVIDSFNYTMPKSKFTGPGEIEELNRLAQKDKVKLGVIPSKYTPEQLDEAKKLCGEPAGTSVPEPRTENHP
jgi:hypothetical protein